MKLVNAAAIAWVAWMAIALWKVEHRPLNPLLIDASATVPTPAPGEDAVAIPDPNLLFTPCPLTPRNIPQTQKRTA